jgi:hypothetical protein
VLRVLLENKLVGGLDDLKDSLLVIIVVVTFVMLKEIKNFSKIFTVSDPISK